MEEEEEEEPPPPCSDDPGINKLFIFFLRAVSVADVNIGVNSFSSVARSLRDVELDNNLLTLSGAKASNTAFNNA